MSIIKSIKRNKKLLNEYGTVGQNYQGVKTGFDPSKQQQTNVNKKNTWGIDTSMQGKQPQQTKTPNQQQQRAVDKFIQQNNIQQNELNDLIKALQIKSKEGSSDGGEQQNQSKDPREVAKAAEREAKQKQSEIGKATSQADKAASSQPIGQQQTTNDQQQSSQQKQNINKKQTANVNIQGLTNYISNMDLSQQNNKQFINNLFNNLQLRA